MSQLNALGDLEHSALRHKLLLVRGEADDGARVEVQDARQRVAGLRQVRDGPDISSHRSDFVFDLGLASWLARGRLGLAVRRRFRGLLIRRRLAPAHQAVLAEAVLEALARHRAVLVGPADGLPAYRVGSHSWPPRS